MHILIISRPPSLQHPIQYSVPSATSSRHLPVTQAYKKILDLQFIDMLEVISDARRFVEEDNTKCCHLSHRTSKQGPITDITLRIECFSILVGILTTKYQTYTPEFIAYQHTIVHAQHSLLEMAGQHTIWPIVAMLSHTNHFFGPRLTSTCIARLLLRKQELSLGAGYAL